MCVCVCVYIYICVCVCVCVYVCVLRVDDKYRWPTLNYDPEYVVVMLTLLTWENNDQRSDMTDLTGCSSVRGVALPKSSHESSDVAHPSRLVLEVGLPQQRPVSEHPYGGALFQHFIH